MHAAFTPILVKRLKTLPHILSMCSKHCMCKRSSGMNCSPPARCVATWANPIKKKCISLSPPANTPPFFVQFFVLFHMSCNTGVYTLISEASLKKWGEHEKRGSPVSYMTKWQGCEPFPPTRNCRLCVTMHGQVRCMCKGGRVGTGGTHRGGRDAKRRVEV